MAILDIDNTIQDTDKLLGIEGWRHDTNAIMYASLPARYKSKFECEYGTLIHTPFHVTTNQPNGLYEGLSLTPAIHRYKQNTIVLQLTEALLYCSDRIKVYGYDNVFLISELGKSQEPDEHISIYHCSVRDGESLNKLANTCQYKISPGCVEWFFNSFGSR